MEIGLDHQILWLGMLRHLWQMLLVIGAVWGLEKALRRAPARFHATLWWVVLLKFLLPVPLLAPYIASAAGAFTWLQPSVRVTTTWAGIRAILEPAALAAEPTVGPRPGADAFLILTVVWAAGVVLILGSGLRAGWRRSRLAVASAFNGDSGRLREATRLAGIAAHRVLLVDRPVMPSLVGLRRSWIVMPRRLCEMLSAEELGAILVHEDAHRRHRDPAKGLLALGTLSLFWFFPPAWLVLARLRKTAELACDEAVLQSGISPAVYARALARTVSFGSLQPLGATAFARPGDTALSQRLLRIRNSRRFQPMVRHRLIVGMAVLLLTVSLLPGAASQAISPQAASPQRATPLDKHDGYVELRKLRGADQVASLEMQSRPLRHVLERLAEQGGFEIDLSGLENSGRLVDFVSRDVTIGAALASLARTEQIGYEVTPDGNLLRVVSVRRIDGDVKPPERIKYLPPKYPEEARREKISGTVVLEVTLAKDGSVRWVDVLKSVHPLLDEAAAEAVEQWRYAPAVYEGDTVDVLLTVTVRFRLE